ncbi:MAG: hypothetical protein MI863_00635 [Desulfobacterales bacterium]|nr:hypothetical protein [Desulfobacterales bacterium]
MKIPKTKPVSLAMAFVFLFSFLFASCSDRGGGIREQVEKPPGAVPDHPYMAASDISKTHADAYSTGSFRTPGPVGPDRVLTKADYDLFPTGPYLISMQYSSPYPDGRQVIWGSQTDRVLKFEVTDSGIRLIDRIYTNALPEVYRDENTGVYKVVDDKRLARMHQVFNAKQGGDLEKFVKAVIPKNDWQKQKYSGVYSVLDNDGNFYVAYHRKIIVFSDTIRGNPDSPIAVRGQYILDADSIHPDSTIVGVTLTWDGHLAIITTRGDVAVVSRDFSRAHYITIEDSGLVRNSVTLDEDGGIYVAGDNKMVRVQWTGRKLTLDPSAGAWESAYETWVDEKGQFWGSGATPALIGSGDDEDKFVVITDGAKVNNLVYFWRDKIPGDWKQIPGTKSRRIAAQVPVDFGAPAIQRSYSEPYVLVHGYDALVVNNVFRDRRTGEKIITNTHAGLMTNRTDFLEPPYGIQKFRWQPGSRTLESAWVNNGVSSPTNVPMMSSGSNMVYINSPYQGNWTLTGIDWTTGKTDFRYTLPGNGFQFNAQFSEIQVLPNGDIIHGTFFGILRIKK